MLFRRIAERGAELFPKIIDFFLSLYNTAAPTPTFCGRNSHILRAELPHFAGDIPHVNFLVAFKDLLKMLR